MPHLSPLVRMTVRRRCVGPKGRPLAPGDVVYLHDSAADAFERAGKAYRDKTVVPEVKAAPAAKPVAKPAAKPEPAPVAAAKEAPEKATGKAAKKAKKPRKFGTRNK